MPIIQPPVAPAKIVNVSVSEFLRGVFGPDMSDAWVCMTPSADHPDWKGTSAGRAQLDGTGWDTQNCYYSVAVLKPGATSRKDVNWSHTRVIVVDDVVEKADAFAVRTCLGRPSFIVQTSPGSQQWGYILAQPITDPAVQARLMRAITLAFFKGIEPGHRDLTRYVRLPVGINNKTSRVQANGGTAPAVVCVRWEPGIKHYWQDLAQALDGVDAYFPGAGRTGKSAWAEADRAYVRHSAGSTEGMPQTLAEAMAYEATDPVLSAFSKLGMVRDMQGSDGYLEVQCPWEHLHMGKLDDRTGWNPVRASRGQTGLHCFHTSCSSEDRSNEGVAKALKAALDQQDGAGSYDALAKACSHASAAQAFGAAPLSAGMLAVQTAMASATGTTAPVQRTWRSVGKGVPVRALPARADMSSLLTRGTVSLLVSQPNVGKSQLAVLKACALAAERHDIFGEERGFAHTGGVIVIGNEDDANEFERRRNACLRANSLSVADLKHDIIVNEQPNFRVVQKSGGGVTLTPEMQRLAADIRAQREAGNDFAAIIVDTQASSFSGLDENSNSDMAAAGALLSGFAQDLDVAVLVIHHTTKDSWRSGSTGMDAARGASGMISSVRCAAMLAPPTPAEEERLPDDQRRGWFRLVITKKSYSRFAADRWFRKVGVDLPTAAPVVAPGAVPGIAPGDSAPACVHDAKGPKLGLDTADDGRVFVAIEAVMSKVDAGEVVLAGATSAGIKGRDVIAEALDAGGKEGGKMQKALVDRGLLEEIEEQVSGRGNRTRTVLRPTAEGRAFVKEHQDAAGTMDTRLEPALDTEELGEGILAGSGEINF